MYSNLRKLIPYIPEKEYDNVAEEFLTKYYPIALSKAMPIPIEYIAKYCMGLDVQYLCLTEEQEIYGMTVFTDGVVDLYEKEEGLYSSKFFKSKTVLIDPEVVRKTNVGCKNNTLAHECLHWEKHRMYYKMQNVLLSRYARICKCSIFQLPENTYEENIMESQAIGIAPRILMPKNTFIETAEKIGVSLGKDNTDAISLLANFFEVSKQSVVIRLKECGLL